MLKKLRIKISIYISLATCLVLLIIGTVLNSVTYFQTIESINNNIELAFKEINSDKIDGRVPRYYAFILDDSNTVVFEKNSNFYIEDKDKNILFNSVHETSNPTRFNNFYYKSFEYDNDEMYVVIDCFTEIENLTRTLNISSIVCSVAAVFISISGIFIAGLAVKPYEIAYENEKRFLTNASHELKTPLTIISSNNDLIESNFGKNKYSDSSKRQISNMTKLINQMVTLNKLEEVGNKIEFKKFNLSDLVYEAISSYEEVFLERGVSISKNIDENVIINKNEEHFIKLISILLDNSNKYINDNGEFIVELKKSKKNTKLVIRNTSSNLDNEKVKHVFERFYTIDESHNSNRSGFGIGLSIANKLAVLNNIKIEAAIIDNKYFQIQIII